jgi:alkylation response protein AidB-like acyl-CoA dehydrogenase
VRNFVEAELLPYVAEWDEEGILPMEVLDKAYEAGVYSPQWPAELGGTPPPAGFDSFYDFIWIDELMRCGCGGVMQAFGIYTMALPPIAKFGLAEPGLTDVIVREVVTAKKKIALCISEPYAGSDVGSMRTTAKREGGFYVLNGAKKWITFGFYADYFTVACRTGGDGAKGISILLVDAKAPGVTVRRMKMQGNWPAGTSHVLFEDVRVPVGRLVGKENEGFRALMLNFNHERFVIAVQANRCARICISEAIQYARSRTTFGQKLVKHQVIRHKIAEMARQVGHAALHTLLCTPPLSAPPPRCMPSAR